MFVKTKFEKIVNVAEFDIIEIKWSVKSRNSANAYHIIHAVSYKSTERKSRLETLAQFSENMKDQAQEAYDDLYSAIFQGKPAFDMTIYPVG